MLRRPLVACSTPPSKWYTALSCAQERVAKSESVKAASKFAVNFTADSFFAVSRPSPTLREPIRIGKSHGGETSENLRPRPGRGIPLLDGGGSRATRRHRLGEEPPRRDGRGGHRWSTRRGGGGSRLGAPRTARCERDRSRGRGNPGELRALRDATQRVGAKAPDVTCRVVRTPPGRAGTPPDRPARRALRWSCAGISA